MKQIFQNSDEVAYVGQPQPECRDCDTHCHDHQLRIANNLVSAWHLLEQPDPHLSETASKHSELFIQEPKASDIFTAKLFQV